MQVTCNIPGIRGLGLRLRTIRALGDDGEMGRTDREAAYAQHGGEVVEFAHGQVDGPPAFLAYDVVVLALIDQVNHPRAMTEMNMTEVAGALEHVDGAIDRRRVNTRPDQCLDSLMQVRSCEVVVVGLGEHFADGAAGLGDAKAR